MKWRLSRNLVLTLMCRRKRLLDRGERLTELLKQPQFSPLKMEEQVAIIFSGTRGYLDKIPVSDVGRFEEELLRHMRDEHKDVLDTIRQGKKSFPMKRKKN